MSNFAETCGTMAQERSAGEIPRLNQPGGPRSTSNLIHAAVRTPGVSRQGQAPSGAVPRKPKRLFRFQPESKTYSGMFFSVVLFRVRPDKDYPTPASNADVIRKPLLVGRHLIILNISGDQLVRKCLDECRTFNPLTLFTPNFGRVVNFDLRLKLIMRIILDYHE